jgi:ABC-2 type transport system ATP-binding protein
MADTTFHADSRAADRSNPHSLAALEAHQLQKIYRQGKQTIEAVRQVSLTIQPSEVLAFLGPNGAGKTTTIKMIAGLIQPDQGWVRIAGHDPHQNLGLDVEASQHVKVLVRTIAQAGCAILLTTHQLNVAEELSDRVAIIQQGKIIAEELTRELIRQFSGSSYQIEFEGELGAARARAIVALGASIHPGHISFAGSSDLLYQLLDLLKPLPLVQVKKDQADLTEVFLKLVRGAS